MKSKSVKLTAQEHRALNLLAFRAGVTVEDATLAIIQNAIGTPFLEDSVNRRILNESNSMPPMKRRPRAA